MEYNQATFTEVTLMLSRSIPTVTLSLCLALAGPACSEDASPAQDAAPSPDQATPDTRAPDAPLPDQRPPDLPTPDVSQPDQTAVDLQPADTGPPSPAMLGCADGTREGFLDHTKFPLIAACGGAWTIKGAHNTTPACKRQAGNSGKLPQGTNCNVTDLCAAGWHVCYGKVDVLSRNAKGCLNILDGTKGPAFFLARTSSTGAFNCSQDSTKFGGPGTSNDLFGCGDLGCKMVQGKCTVGGAGCDPLKDCAGCKTGDKCANGSVCKPSVCFPLTTASHDLCKGLRNDKNCGAWCNHLGKHSSQKNTWDCGKDTKLEANNVLKGDPAVQGGVLCCRD